MTIDEFILELKKINITLNQNQIKQLEKYYEMVINYNKVMNLTGITEKKEFYLKHFYDSLTLNKIISLNNINTLCDIGSGAGFPGIVLKIAFPNLKITLVDSLNKRINFLNKVIEELQLQEITTIHQRAEIFAKNNIENFDLVTARAVAKLNILLEISIPMLKINGNFIAMKSNINDEVKNINSLENILNCKVIDIQEFLLPIENSKRTLVKIEKLNKTSIIYPRKFEQIKKKPL